MKMSGTNMSGIHGLLSDPRILQTRKEDQTWYSATGVIQVLTETQHPDEAWRDLVAHEPELEHLSEPVEFLTDEETQASIVADALTFDGVLRLVQSVSSPRAERIKRWLVESARHRLEEAEDPELALLRARKLYQTRGYSRRWIEKRLRGVSARHELTGEWYRRGARQPDDYRALTNALIKNTFGKDVPSYRQLKGLGNTKQNLRDHMSELELAVTGLAETIAAILHRERRSEGVEQLEADLRDAGQILASTIAQIDNCRGTPVVIPASPTHTAPSRPIEGTTVGAAPNLR